MGIPDPTADLGPTFAGRLSGLHRCGGGPRVWRTHENRDIDALIRSGAGGPSDRCRGSTVLLDGSRTAHGSPMRAQLVDFPDAISPEWRRLALELH